MKKKVIILIIICLFLIVGAGIFLWRSSLSSTITLDINPSLKIILTRSRRVKRVTSLNDDAKDIVKGDFKGKTLDATLKKIANNVVEKDYLNQGEVFIILYSTGSIKNEIIKSKIENSFSMIGAKTDIIVIEKISKKDERLAKKYNISPAKAAYINSILKENSKVSVDELVNKSVYELKENKTTGRYCDSGYKLEGDSCLKEIERIAASIGKICPHGYMDYEGICYKEGTIKTGKNYVCDDTAKLVNNKCIITERYDAIANCKNGRYDDYLKKCIEKKYLGEPEEFCRLTPETDILIDHKCYGPKPTINGGCLGSDVIINGKCVDMNSYYESDWVCKMNGKTWFLGKDDEKKCYEEVAVDSVSYSCDNDGKLKGTECVRETARNAQKERTCSSGYTLVNNSFCINYNNIANKEDGFICRGDTARLKDNTCIIYDIVEAKHY